MRFHTLIGAILIASLAGGAQAQSYYGSDRILHHYDPFDTIPGTEIEGGLGSGLPPAPARPLIIGTNGNAVYAPTNPLLAGPQYVDPRRYGTLEMTQTERRLYFAKDPAAYARRHAGEPRRIRWRGEATNPVVASPGYRPSPEAAEHAYAAALRGRVGSVARPAVDDILYLPKR